MNRSRRILPALAAIVVLGAGAVVLVSALQTSGARVAATTSGTSFITAGTVELTRPDSSVELIFDANGLYPGLEVSGCVDVVYRGSIASDVRVHAAKIGGDGLERFIEIDLSLVPGGCAKEAAIVAQTLYAGALDALFADHSAYASAIGLQNGVSDGSVLGVRALATVVDDNEAQARTVEFSLTIEARP